MGSEAPRPVVGIPSCRRFIDPQHYHTVGEKYLTAVAEAAGAIPVIFPSLGKALALELVLSHCDGVMLTGSPSNVEPYRYDGKPSRPGTMHDAYRDATTLELIPRIVSAGIPLFGICRGFQEINVAYGGTLHQNVHEQDEMHDHREDPSQPLAVQYAPAHEVELMAGGLLAAVAGGRRQRVNSVHHQGVERLGSGLVVEACAPDGLVEAVRVAGAPGFTLGVQWHPEWRPADDPFYSGIFELFGNACQAFADRRKAA
jgi:putative glutamine amidotransferase